MDPQFEHQLLKTRRQFFGDVGLRLGGIAMAMMMGQKATSAAPAPQQGGPVHPPLPGFPNLRPRATSIIYLHMNGGPSQIDLWDYKPQLRELFDKDLPPSVRGEQRLSTMTS